MDIFSLRWIRSYYSWSWSFILTLWFFIGKYATKTESLKRFSNYSSISVASTIKKFDKTHPQSQSFSTKSSSQSLTKANHEGLKTFEENQLVPSVKPSSTDVVMNYAPLKTGDEPVFPKNFLKTKKPEKPKSESFKKAAAFWNNPR